MNPYLLFGILCLIIPCALDIIVKLKQAEAERLRAKLNLLKANAAQDQPDFVLSDAQLERIIDSLDDTGGYLVKGNELKYWIAKYVNEDRNNR